MTTPASRVAPPLARRLACLVYEALLLFGLGLVPGVLGALFVAQTGQGHPLQSATALRVYALVFYAVYFVWFWSARGQTLAMQTWRIAVVRADGSSIGQRRALLRFVACCLAWFGAPLAVSALAGAGAKATLALVAAWVPLWALASRLEPDGQFWHDRASGTRLIDLRERAAANA